MYNFIVLWTALPALYRKPTFVVQGTTLIIRWDAWNADIDYGTGPVEKYQVYLAETSQPLVPFRFSDDNEEEIPNLLHETMYTFAVSALRVFASDSFEGVIGPEESAKTGCGGMLWCYFVITQQYF